MFDFPISIVKRAREIGRHELFFLSSPYAPFSCTWVEQSRGFGWALEIIALATGIEMVCTG